ncbi:uncharacterized protein ZBIST_2576 [Zygosaccharomyces bailii]|uniref:ZYBA0S09-00364g1_1 n=1 Tax=Zygosaccharomyces bailii (strain CLIB 213 / ATCC 58445 / CBS 680 / BCRC 21525 / NBRC 1098 / NCYC 1416 / NRRL Y-2227) TaxID=1333698 RepID=A0A8J2T8X1_ZYGB2|nr:ZYBA0S09-00364g1_1 [Zygosaccharomyces bailii CLIB 213]SJM85976.1 uncharacterized protein ZBIST_2576 [Zygosaccharomyces bailii]
MDFTSDSKLGSQHSAEPSASTTASVTGLDAEQERVLELQDRRDELLERRRTLREEVERLEGEQQGIGIGRDTVFRRTALLDLAELVPESNPKLPSVLTLDGSTEVEEELRYKHDCLPLLNMDLRLKYLKEMYPHVSLSMQDSRTLVAEFHRMAQDPFQLQLKLSGGEVTLSENVRWVLGPLKTMQNPTAVLQGCYEFDRLRCRREMLFQEISTFAGSKGISSHTSGSLLSLERGALNLQFRFEIDIQEKFLFPHTRLESRLLKNSIPVSTPDVQSVLEGLMQEYGVLPGIVELCKACFT